MGVPLAGPPGGDFCYGEGKLDVHWDGRPSLVAGCAWVIGLDLVHPLCMALYLMGLSWDYAVGLQGVLGLPLTWQQTEVALEVNLLAALHRSAGSVAMEVRRGIQDCHTPVAMAVSVRVHFYMVIGCKEPDCGAGGQVHHFPRSLGLGAVAGVACRASCHWVNLHFHYMGHH